MHFAIYGKSASEASIPYLESLLDKLAESRSGIFIYEPYLQVIRDKVKLPAEYQLFYHNQDIRDRVDVLLSIGGDGTLLDTITLVRNSGIPILGINLGKLGFLTSISREDLSDGIDQILSGEYNIDERTLLRLEDGQKLFGELAYALNELTVYKKGSLSMITVHTYVNDRFLNSYWGDGLIVSTPTGSTAYSLSCGGPIIIPEAENFVITPIATHNLTVRPVIIPDNSLIRIRVEGRQKHFNLSLDSRSLCVEAPFEFSIRKENFKIKLLKLKDWDFFRTIRSKLNWGMDIRN
ncbi:MAG TPA: NAD kinase [Bacteroidales bacterium]|nr:NAD kinase [Bacteroidales bacterium]HSA42862.1 NAD kinase [Bacteroidales bacterium]